MSGKRERPRDFDIDPNTLEYKKNQGEGEESSKRSTPEEIAARKIYKIKTSTETANSSSKPIFTLKKTNEKEKQVGTENKQQKAQQTQKQGSENKDAQSQQQKPASIFSLNSGGSLFGNSLLNNSNKNIFANPFSFDKDKKFENTFGAGEGLFSKKSNGEQKQGIFKLGSIFNFSSTSVPPVKKSDGKDGEDEEDGEDGEDDNNQLEKQQNIQIDPSKSSGNYEYQKECEILFSSKANKLKKNNGQLIENVQIIVQKDLEKNIHWLIARLAATKTPIVNGLILKKLTEIKNINSKDQNVCVSVLVHPKDKSQDAKPQKHTLKNPI